MILYNNNKTTLLNTYIIDINNSLIFITMQKKIRIIAEAGVNHNGDINNVYKLINIASKAKCDFVKFQITNASLISKYAPKANYQMITTNKKESQHEMIKKLEFDWDILHPKLVNYCKKKEY